MNTVVSTGKATHRCPPAGPSSWRRPSWRCPRWFSPSAWRIAWFAFFSASNPRCSMRFSSPPAPPARSGPAAPGPSPARSCCSWSSCLPRFPPLPPLLPRARLAINSWLAGSAHLGPSCPLFLWFHRGWCIFRLWFPCLSFRLCSGPKRRISKSHPGTLDG